MPKEILLLKRIAATLAGMLALTWIGPLHAAEGAIEINQTCATQTGCLPGDAAGFPVTLFSPGSYLLTGNLQVPDADTTAILVRADDVTIDLGGFSIRGVTVCSWPSTSCSPTGNGHGIFVNDSLQPVPVRTEVRNGAVVGMGGYGILLGDGYASVVSGVRAASNGSVGINAANGGRIVDSIVHLNGNMGIQGNTGMVLRGNTAHQNGGIGISAGDRGTVTGNTAIHNGGSGIYAGTGSSVEGNTSSFSGSHGIETGFDCLVARNVVANNGGAGLQLENRSAYRGNVVNGNASTVSATSGVLVDLGANSCNGTASCP